MESGLSRLDAITEFLLGYDDKVSSLAIPLHELLLKSLPNIQEQLDLPARIIGYGYSNKYSDSICVIIPSKKGLKLGFNRGSELPDQKKLLGGSGKVHRYAEIKSSADIKSPALKKLLADALKAYKARTKK
jgi:hypothetical protein